MGYYFSRQPLPDPPSPPLMKKDWRAISSGDLMEKLRKEHRHPSVKHLRILTIGPVQAGKSSFIHSIQSILQNKLTNGACKVSPGGKSFTRNYTIEKFKDDTGRPLPFVIGDVMGLENGEDSGVHPDDIINILQGHIKEDYKFNPLNPCSEQDPKYKRDPTINDKIHCLVFIIPTDNFTANSSCETNVLLGSDLIRKMETIRRKASDLKIRHVVVLTKADLACPSVKEDIKLVYKSKAIHRKAQACSKAMGIPLNCIFPVKNYSDETQVNPDINAVLLHTLTRILDAANESVEEMPEDKDGEGDIMDDPPTM